MRELDVAKFIAKMREFSRYLKDRIPTAVISYPDRDEELASSSKVLHPETNLALGKNELIGEETLGASAQATLTLEERKPDRELELPDREQDLPDRELELPDRELELPDRELDREADGKTLATLLDTKVDRQLEKPNSEPDSDPDSNGKATAEISSQPEWNPIDTRRLFLCATGFAALGGSVGALGYGWWYANHDLPDVAEVLTFVRDGTVTIKAGNGKILQQVGPATREKLRVEDIPQTLVDAFIASEDSRFYEHKGIDYQGILRAIASNLWARQVVEGGSTITQQLARTVFLTQERTIRRKVREALLAREIELHLNKDQLLEYYLNNVYLGSGAYGVADAAWVYFSKSVEELTLPEIATIAGLPPAPSNYSPLVNSDFARKRRNIVLQRMVDVGVLSPARAAIASDSPIEVNPSAPKRLVVEAPYFTSYIKKELPKYVSAEALETGGLTVETTIDLKWQAAAEKVVREAVEIDGYNQGFDQAALVAIDPRSGEIKAMVGGRDYSESEFNRVTQAQRQPGSTFKGFVYAAAIAAGFSPYDGYKDANFTVDGYKPRNFGGKYRGWVSMRDALTDSINVVAVKVLMHVGFEPTIKLASDMGIRSEMKPTYSLALGGWELNLLELTSAYGTLAAEGNYVPPHGIVRVTDRRGEVVYESKYKQKRALDSETASIVTWMLEPVVQYGTGTAAQLSDRPVAGKTGTSDEARDLWFVGYIPQLVAGVWLGNDDSYPTWGDSQTAAFVWRQFMQDAIEDIPVEEFPDLPEQLEGRKASIEAKPVTPQYQVIYGDTTPDDEQKDKNQNNDGYYQEW